MSRRKTREGGSSSNSRRAKRYQLMPWLSASSADDADRRPVFALILQRMMSGCEMIDYGVKSSSTSPGAKNSTVNFHLPSDAESKINQLADCNGNALVVPDSLLFSAAGNEQPNDGSLLIAEAGTIGNYNYSRVESAHLLVDDNNNALKPQRNWWEDENDDENLKIVQQVCIDDYNNNNNENDCSRSFVELIPTGASLSSSLAAAFQGRYTGGQELLVPFTNDGDTGGYVEPQNARVTSEIDHLTSSSFVQPVVDGKKKKRKNSMSEKSVSCSRCNKRFRKESHLKTHFVVHTTADNGAASAICRCGLCGKGFCHRGALALHMRAHAPKARMTLA
ncbi:uncharacterized protein LOC106640991 isoform X2 [Copidosoma floridanum]|uniref:uncharacterized protein LOC106640991 isoform X2 n=1 Tax=Copidosoma floridanum TaxID=29053 RepID=UPI0006C9E5AA|nr:uncharacterized protein LOC106640991 isoform X2 [Copidosoma floridanum]